MTAVGSLLDERCQPGAGARCIDDRGSGRGSARRSLRRARAAPRPGRARPARLPAGSQIGRRPCPRGRHAPRPASTERRDRTFRRPARFAGAPSPADRMAGRDRGDGGPYAFPTLLGDVDLHLLAEGRHYELASCLGALPMEIAGARGVRFAVWAPNARARRGRGRLQRLGLRRHPMRLRHGAGVWELFVPRLGPGARYKYAIPGPMAETAAKADPVARQAEPPPATASVVAPGGSNSSGHDDAWMPRRASSPRHPMRRSRSTRCISASWLRIRRRYGALLGRGDHAPHSLCRRSRLHPYRADAYRRASFRAAPGDISRCSLFAPTARYGTRRGLRSLRRRLPRANIGVIVDWVPAHFPTDAHGARPLRRHGALRTPGPARRLPQGLEHADLQFRPPRGAGFPHRERPALAAKLSCRRACASMPWPRCSIATTAASAGEWVANIHGGRENSRRSASSGTSIPWCTSAARAR